MLILIKFHLTELCTLLLLAAGNHVILEVADEAPCADCHVTVW